MSKISNMFTDVFFPISPKEFLGNSEIVEECLKWGEKWVKGEKQKPILLFGETGTGKTTLAILLAKYFEWQLFELNASDFRTKEIVERLVGGASQNASLDGRKRLVLLDEVDGITGTEDKGGLNAILQIIKEAQNPIILTANDIYARKNLAPLRNECIQLQFKKINYLSIANYLKEICKKKEIEFEEEAIKELAKNCSGDLRAALLDLQSLSYSKKITLAEIQALSFREREEDVFKTLNAIFHGKTFEEIHSARMKSEIDSEMLMNWVEENIPRQMQNPEDCANAFDLLSRADIFNGRIYKRQNYDFLRYSSELSTTGVGLQKQHSSHQWVKYEFPSIIRKLSSDKSARNMRKQVALKIGKKMHSSSKAVLSKDFPFFQQILENREKIPEFIAAFDLEEEEIAFLLNTKPDTKKVQEAMEKAKELKEKEILAKRNFFHAISEEEIKKHEKKLKKESDEAAEKETKKSGKETRKPGKEKNESEENRTKKSVKENEENFEKHSKIKSKEEQSHKKISKIEVQKQTKLFG